MSPLQPFHDRVVSVRKISCEYSHNLFAYCKLGHILISLVFKLVMLFQNVLLVASM